MKEKKKKGKGCWIILAIFVSVVVLFVCAATSGVDKANTDISTNEEILDENNVESGTSAKVDLIVRQAKMDAQATDAETKAEQAYNWIVENVPQWYDGAEVMEKAIYNGALVEYFYEGKNSLRAEIGVDTVQSVKYVYRGVETVLDEATKNNLDKIQKNIAKEQN